jgi:hypothetical protein
MPGATVQVKDDVLGLLAYGEDGENWWTATVDVCGRQVRFDIGGEGTPDLRLLEHAREIVRSYADFRSRVRAFLARDAARWSEFAEEIRGLEIEGVMLTWPDRPRNGMIFFSGGDDCRLWRCDYVDGEPVDLGFDS